MKQINHCANELDQHSLIPVSWEVSPYSKHVGQLLCEKCFRLFDHQEIADFHMAHHGKRCETV